MWWQYTSHKISVVQFRHSTPTLHPSYLLTIFYFDNHINFAFEAQQPWLWAILMEAEKRSPHEGVGLSRSLKKVSKEIPRLGLLWGWRENKGKGGEETAPSTCNRWMLCLPVITMGSTRIEGCGYVFLFHSALEWHAALSGIIASSQIKVRYEIQTRPSKVLIIGRAIKS